MERTALQPFIKWPGGKRWAASRIVELIRPHLSGTYFEPFLGGGAIFFHLLPKKSVLADLNEDLINTYKAVRRGSADVLRALRHCRITENAYYLIRAREPVGLADRAARFLYLNRTAFGGIYRVNLQGRFNVPYGGGERTPEILWKSDVLELAASALRKARLKVCDFEPLMETAGAGDVVYCDPTYTVAHDNNGFIRYNERNFSWSDQQRLASAAFRAARRGAFVVVSNAHHSSVKRLYSGAKFQTLCRMSTVTPHANHRREVEELLISLSPHV